MVGMDDKGEKVLTGARVLLERFKTQQREVPTEVMEIQDLLECVEQNADRIAHAMRSTQRKRATSTAGWTDVKLLLCEQDRLFAEIARLMGQLSARQFVTITTTTAE
ncbi:hypothetical protein Poli38472_012868 [Pythium oligandrum]|uniref:Uncharacterized protein n=1 Tax=Pythium oligandrum TaxID=41045 RepID=A0A8K1FIV5_PYTOL|nr:hypothetical protein Poli38472_012868 [Pythium oligandrum]|eukprot:TMW64246.1 hypothetical protein Poli38472_012868 [Pythium oligandrum]